MARALFSAIFRVAGRLLVTSAFLSSSARAALVLSADLGTLGPGATAIQGDTAGGSDNAAFYFGLSEPTGNWGKEVVYQFTVAETLVASLSSRAMIGDADVFLLSGLSTTPVGSKPGALEGVGRAYLDDGPGIRETAGVIAPGTYYLVVDAWNGPDGAVVVTEARFDLSLSLTAPEPLGVLGDNATSLTIDTLGSGLDTELALFDSSGSLLAASDDIVPGIDGSELAAGMLERGEYHLALGGWNSRFGHSFSAVGGEASGPYQLNHPGGSTTGTAAAGELEWFSFTIVPESSVLGMLGLSSLSLISRRRQASCSRPSQQ